MFRVGSRDAELLAPEFRPMDAGGLADQEPFTAWLRRGIGRDRIFAEPQLYEPLGTADTDPRAEPAAVRPTPRRDRTATSLALMNSATSMAASSGNFAAIEISTAGMIQFEQHRATKKSRNSPENTQFHHATHSLKVKFQHFPPRHLRP